MRAGVQGLRGETQAGALLGSGKLATELDTRLQEGSPHHLLPRRLSGSAMSVKSAVSMETAFILHCRSFRLGVKYEHKSTFLIVNGA